ncbi:MAG: hypothetical protein N3C12_11925 [Candidatus Binatia bacterium]|nr:hypothetical protein [Candidatus Binatia bacterium]
MGTNKDVVVIAGYFARCPLGGYAWQVLHYLLGFEELGFEAYFYEDTALYGECFDPVTRTMPARCDRGVEILSKFFAAHGLGKRWHFWEVGSQREFGLPRSVMLDLLERARLVLTLAPVTRVPQAGRATRVFIDLDPGYTQFRYHQGDEALRSLLHEHHRHFTIGELIGSPACAVPTGNLHWLPTRQPVVTRLWLGSSPAEDGAWTTIGRWHETRRDIVTGNDRYGWSKRDEWLRFLDLPQRAAQRFCVAMDVAKFPNDLALLNRYGWEVVDPLAVSADPFVYRDFICSSAGEFTTAKDLNVRLRTGWFSDRSACYLAAGRPVVTQATGFEQVLPTAEGLFAVTTVEEAAAAIRAVASDPLPHRAHAQLIARTWFEARQVLHELIEHV